MPTRLKSLVLAMLAIMVALVTAPQARAEDYQGLDGGYLVLSAGSIAIPMNFSFSYRALVPAPGSRRAWTGTIGCGCVGTWGPRRDFDYTGRENGKVSIRRLPPGDYEIHDFGFGGTLAGMMFNYSSGQPFVIPFTIRPGEATYIGNFARAVSLGTVLEKTLGATGYFVISDQSARDLPIARARQPDLPEVTIAVTDVSSFGHPSLRNSEL